MCAAKPAQLERVAFAIAGPTPGRRLLRPLFSLQTGRCLLRLVVCARAASASAARSRSSSVVIQPRGARQNPKLAVLPYNTVGLNTTVPFFKAPTLQARNAAPTTRDEQSQTPAWYLPYDRRYLDLWPFSSHPPTDSATANMKCYLEFVCTPSADTAGTTLLLHFDNRRYFFGNVAEGTQRACVEQGIGLMNLNDVFLTGKTNWQNTGGLLGLVLTIADSTGSAATQFAAEHQSKVQDLKKRIAALDPTNKKQAKMRKDLEAQLERTKRKYDDTQGAVPRKSTLSLYGAPNLTHLLATARRFIFRKGLPFYVTEYGNDWTQQSEADNQHGPISPSFEDENIKVWAMPVRTTTSTPSAGSDGERSSRKRTRTEFEEKASTANAADATSASAPSSASSPSLPTPPASRILREQQERDHIIRQATVSQMFNSDWQMDALTEIPLREAHAGAALFVRDPETQKIRKFERAKDGSDAPDTVVLTRKPWPGANIESLPPTTPSDVSVSYIVQHHDVRGKFDPQKAIALKVEKGAKFGLLTKGESVLSADGKTITPEMVMGKTQPGRAFLVADLPSAEYVDGFLAREEFTRNPALIEALASIVWILGHGLADDEKLRQFMQSLPNVKHIISSPDRARQTVAFRSSAIALTRFSKVDSDRYRPPLFDDASVSSTSRADGSSEQTAEQENVVAARPGMALHLQPVLQVDETGVAPLFDTSKVLTNEKPSSVAAELQSLGFQERLTCIRRNPVGHDVEIFALGTGSSLPSKYRNVSATLFRVPGEGTYLLDCGEGTLGQLKRLFPPDELQQVLRDLRVIWISHLHADHHLGTATVIRAWNEAVHGRADRPVEPPRHDVDAMLRDARQENRLFVVGGLRMMDWLREYANVEHFGFDKIVPLTAVSYLDNSGSNRSFFKYHHLNPDMSLLASPTTGDPVITPLYFDENDPQNHDPAMSRLLQAATGVSRIDTVLVPHCHDARAVSFTFPSGFKLSYSGDCRPSPRFAAVGRDSTVLIHEATFEDDMGADAVAKRHSTVSEALDIARQMRARNLILTHFSQRYQSVPNLRGARHNAQAKSRRSSSRGSGSSTSTSTSTGAAKAAASRTTYDVPVMNEGDADESTAATTGDSSADSEYDPQLVPVVVAFDLMRLRLGDAAYAEAHLNALMRAYVATEGEDEASAAVATTTTQGGKHKPGKKGKGGAKDAKQKADQKGTGSTAQGRDRSQG